MRRLMCFATGIAIGSIGACLLTNSKKTMTKLVGYGDMLLQDLNSKLEQVALMVENMDEEKIKRRMKAKYAVIKKKVQSIDLKKFTEDTKIFAESLLQDLNNLINSNKSKEA